MKKPAVFVQWFLPLLILIIFHSCTAKETKSMPQSNTLEYLLRKFIEYRQQHKEFLQQGHNTVFVLVLSFIVSFVCSAGGVGGGPLFIPILNLVAGIDLKTSSSYSAFMVSGVLLSNVLFYLFFSNANDIAGRPLINYKLALVSQPCLLFGVSLGVIFNVMFPEWLITVLFSVFLAFATYKTLYAGIKLWNAESNGIMTRSVRMDRAEVVIGDKDDVSIYDSLFSEVPASSQNGIQWNDLLILTLIWVCFFLLHFAKEDKDILGIPPCGIAYWLITFSQLPITIGFTAYILHTSKLVNFQNDNAPEAFQICVFPSTALLTGVLSGLFGIGGGLLLNPMLLQIGVPPQTAAATSTFMLLFSASMSMVQYVILGMKGLKQASLFALVCFVASAIGLAVIQRAIQRSGRASVIIFVVTGVMAVSLIVITGGGIVDTWEQYTSGTVYMGFRPPC